MIVHNTKNIKPIEKLYAVLSVDENGNEGIVAADLKVGLGIAPLVCGELSLIKKMLERARKEAGHLTEKKMHIATFIRE